MQRFTNTEESNVASIYLPTMRSSRSAACGLRRVQMSMVKRVLLLLKMDAKEDMRAANITASMRPRKPAEMAGGKEDGERARDKSVKDGKRLIRRLLSPWQQLPCVLLTIRHD